MLKVQAACVAAFVLLGTWTSSQGPKEPVWVAQAPPFGAIATLGGFPELSAFYPMAGPLAVDIRLSEEWNGWGQMPVRFVRLTSVGKDVRGSLLLWWIGKTGPEKPTDRARCTTPAEGVPVCIQPIPVAAQYEWGSLLQTILAAEPSCPEPHTTHIYKVKAQVFDRSQGYPMFRLLEICDPLATKVSEVFNELVAAAKGRPEN
jgi:hypothetical protein